MNVQAMPATMQASQGDASVHLILRILQPSQARFATLRPDMPNRPHVAPLHGDHVSASNGAESFHGPNTAGDQVLLISGNFIQLAGTSPPGDLKLL